jgi:PAS domain S-box-containing protein
MLDAEAERLQALRDFAVLDTQPEERFDRLTALVAGLFDAPIALVSLIDEDRQWFKSRFGLAAPQTPRAWAFCDHAIKAGPHATLVVEDASADPRFAENPLVTGDPNIRFYAGATLTTASGHNLGTLCVIDREARPEPSPSDMRRLRAMANMVVDQLELTRATRALAEQKRLLELAESMSGVGRWRYDIASGRVDWSDEVYRIHGVDPAEFAPDLDLSLDFFLPEDRALAAVLVDRAMRCGEDYAFQLRLTRPDGALRHVSCKASCELDANGAVRALFGVFQDVTEQVSTLETMARSEARYRLLTENANDTVTRIDLNGRFHYVSPAVTAMTGYSVDELIGQPALDFIHPDDIARVQAAFRAAMAGQGSWQIEYRLIDKTGQIVWVEARPSLARDPATGEVVGVTDVIRDITEHRRLQEALERARADAEAATIAKSEFLANMSHELRAPLNGVLGFTDLLAASALDEAQRGYVERIVSAGRSLLGVINDILDFSKIEAGRLTIEQRPYDLRDVIGEVVELVGAANSTLDVALSTAIAPHLAPAYEGDEHRVRQILTNIVGNAVKFTRAGVARVSADVDGERLCIRVVDTGPGIPADRLDAIFDGFTQADSSVAREYGGTGLGLAISRSLARLMGGDLVLESVLGVGTTATLYLPNRPSQTVPSPTRSTMVRPEVRAPRPSQPRRAAKVMIVDDVEMNRELVQISLGQEGFDVAAFASAKAAIAALEAGEGFDVILMDVQMPEMDGLTATRHIRAMSGPARELPIIALTANALPEQAARCLAAGMTSHLAKPIDMPALIARLRDIEAPEPKRAEPAPVGEAPKDPLADLHRRYRAYLADLPREIADLMACEVVDVRTREVAALAHTVAGASGSFGFREVSDAAFALEALAKSALDGAASPKALDSAVEAFVAELTRAAA